MDIKATFAAPKKDISIKAFRKEKSFYRQMSLFSGQKELVTVRFYGSGSTCYCCVWVNFPHSGYLGEYPTQHPVGGGKCNTFSQDKESEAFSNACTMAGYSFDAHLSAGDMNIGNIGHEALLSIAESLGFTESWILSANA